MKNELLLEQQEQPQGLSGHCCVQARIIRVLFGAGFFTSAFATGALGDFSAQRLRLCIGLAVVVALVAATASVLSR